MNADKPKQAVTLQWANRFVIFDAMALLSGGSVLFGPDQTGRGTGRV